MDLVFLTEANQESQYRHFQCEEGDLVIVLRGGSAKATVRKILQSGEDNFTMLKRIVNKHFLSGWRWIEAEEIGLRTDISHPPLLAKEWSENAEGKLEYVRRIYYYDLYPLCNPVQTLYEDGYVVFQHTDNNEEFFDGQTKEDEAQRERLSRKESRGDKSLLFNQSVDGD